MSNTELKERIYNKAMSQLLQIEAKIDELENTVPYMALTQEMINGQIKFQEQEHAVWTEIFYLNEKNY